MGIKESNLPIAESLGSGDKLRIVTAEGESKQISASAVGGSVQKIKLGTANGGGASVEGGISFSGGFALPNGTTVYDLIGDKIVIGFSGEFEQEGSSENQHTEYVTNLNVWIQQDSSMTTGDIRTATAEERATFTGFVVNGIVPNRSAGALAMDIYAICI